jgi:outer membrane lipoprotein LolB
MRSRLAHRGLPGLLWVLAVAVVAGCRTVPVAVQPPGAGAQPWDVTRPALQGHDHFQLQGRVAVAAGKDGFSAALNWTQAGTVSQVSLEGPLGAGAMQITANGDNLSILNSHGDHLDSDAARADLEARLGFEPPLGSLRYWILGVPDPATPAKESLDSQQQRLQSLSQDGWQVDYAGYMPNGGGWLPSRLTVQRKGVRVRVVVNDWHL